MYFERCRYGHVKRIHFNPLYTVKRMFGYELFSFTLVINN